VTARATNLPGDGRPAGRERARSAPAEDPSRASAVLWVLSVLVLVGIVAMSLVPGWEPGLPGPKHLPHAVAYAVLMVTVLAALTKRRPVVRPGVMVAAAVGLGFLVVTIGALLELGQRAVHRDVQAMDVAADAAGVAAALIAWIILRSVLAPGRR
jgi:hypothetical protein